MKLMSFWSYSRNSQEMFKQN